MLIVTAMLAALIMLVVQIDRAIRPAVEAVCQEECRSYCALLIGRSIDNALQENPHSYSDFAELLYDENGNIAAVETLTGNVNRMQSCLMNEINQALDESRDAEISVSLGTASGVWIFAGRGPHIPLRFLPIGNAQVELISSLDSAGINQTCHKILIKVKVHAAASAPLCRTETDIEYEYLLAETVLVGDVPNGYAVLGE